MNPHAAIVADGDGVLLSVHVQPGAKRPGLAGWHGDAVKVRVSAPPVDGRANDAVVALVAEVLGVPAGAVTVVAGHTSRRKRLRISGRDAADVRDRLATQGVD